MAMARLLFALFAGALCVLFAAPAAIGKEDVRATLDTPVPIEAAGKTITVAWTLSYSDRGRSRPFGAGGVFVRLTSASGGAPVKTVGKEVARGRYVAEARVPEGGIGGISMGLEGTRYIGGRAEDADSTSRSRTTPLRWRRTGPARAIRRLPGSWPRGLSPPSARCSFFPERSGRGGDPEERTRCRRSAHGLTSTASPIGSHRMLLRTSSGAPAMTRSMASRPCRKCFHPS